MNEERNLQDHAGRIITAYSLIFITDIDIAPALSKCKLRIALSRSQQVTRCNDVGPLGQCYRAKFAEIERYSAVFKIRHDLQRRADTRIAESIEHILNRRIVCGSRL